MIEMDHAINDKILKRFSALEQRKRLAHAYLFVGPACSGKSQTALAVAKMVNCRSRDGAEESYCDQCPDCMKVNSSNHPDVHMIDNGSGESIKIEQVRALLDQIKLRPFIASRKIFIIKNADSLTLQGANALLKTLEEPTASSLLILTTSVIEKNLDTVKSRCHAVYFLPSTKDHLADQLAKYYDEDRLSSHLLAYFAEGCLGKARKLQQDKLYETRGVIIKQFIFSSSREGFIKTISSDKEKIKEFLDILLSWMRDALLSKVGVEESRLIHLDQAEQLKRFQVLYSFEELDDLNTEIIKTRQLLVDNFNIKIPLLIIQEKFNG